MAWVVYATLFYLLLGCTLSSQAPKLGSVNEEISSGSNAVMLKELLQTLHQRELSNLDASTIESLLKLYTRSNANSEKRSNESSADSEWRDLILEGVRKNLYATANSALAILQEKLAKGALSLNSLECVSTEDVMIGENNRGILEFVYALPTESSFTGTDSDTAYEFPFTSYKACQHSELVLPKGGYVAPYETNRGSRTMTSFNGHEDIIQFALDSIEQRKGPEANLRPVSMSEEVREYMYSSIQSFLVGVIEMPINAGAEKPLYVLVIYYPASKPVGIQHERDYIITLQGDINDHQVIVSSIGSHGHTLTGHSTTPREGHQKRGDGFALNILSYNIWNFNGDWPKRRELIVNTVRTYHPNVVGFQEIRYKYESSEGNQLAQMAFHLPNYNYVYQPAMRYESEAEGVGILTTFPIALTNWTNLKYLPGSPDQNKRIALRALLETPGGEFDFFVTHFSYAKGAGQMQNAVDLLGFMDLSSPHVMAQAVVGDFNIYTDSVEPTDFLTGRRPFRGRTGNLKDVWETVHGKNDGYTFSNLPWSSGLINRADRILVRGDIKPVTVDRVGQYNPAETSPASDHLGVLTSTK